MARSKGGRPPARGSGGRSRPPGRWDKPPTGNTGYGKGTKHKSSSVEGTPMIGLVYAIAGGVVLVIGSITAYLAHGYGVI